VLTEGYNQDPWFAQAQHTGMLKLVDGVWWRGDQVVIPNDELLKRSILYELHDAYYSGHFGETKSIQAVQRMYWWPGMIKDIKRYVQACPTCQRNKAPNNKPAGLLQPLPVPTEPWQHVTMDFITQLPQSITHYDAIFVVVDRLTKMVHFAPTTTTVTAEGTAKLYRDYVWKLHGVPETIISDRGSVFTSKFLVELTTLLGSHQKFSTAFHPQTDGLTERVNRVLEDMLRHYTSVKQDDWDEFLASAEFAVNNAYHESIGTTPFRLWCGRDPRLPLSVALPAMYKVAAAKNQKAAEFADRLQNGLVEAKKALEAARQRQKHFYDGKHRQVSFRVGDMVLLSSKNLKLKGVKSPKLQPKWVGPFEVIQRIGEVAYKLTLPGNMKIHNVFHVSILRLYKDDGRAPPPQPLDIDGELYYSIDRVLDHRVVKRGRGVKREYLIRWRGYDNAHDSWEPEHGIAESEHGATLLAYWKYIGVDPPSELV
jgi:hypothetical protein